MPLEVRHYRPGDEAGIVNVIVPIQSEEFGIAITAADQPDLAAIAEFYLPGAGGFWVAADGDDIVGTISLRDIGNATGALRKMFVAAPYRGAAFGVGGRLLQTLLDHARRHGLRTILLGTTDRYLAAHRFYEKNGFQRIDADQLPASFPRMAVDNWFYRLDLAASPARP
jgi:N-acetylglutamate synthase-like GNAT family acetyltransferase